MNKRKLFFYSMYSLYTIFLMFHFLAPKDEVFFDLIIVAYRRIVHLVRDARTVILDAFMTFCLGILVALLFGDIEVDSIGAVVSATCLALGLLSTVQGLRAFGYEKPLLLRETDAGLSLVSNFFGTFLGTIPDIFIVPIAFCAGFYGVAQPRGDLRNWFWVMVLIQWTGIGCAYLISLVWNRKNMISVAMAYVLLCFLTDGLEPSTEVLFENGKFIGRFFWWQSFLRFGAKGLVLADYISYSPVFEDFASGYISSLDNNKPMERAFNEELSVVAGWMFFHGVVTRLLSLVYMYWAKDGFKYYRYVRDSFYSWLWAACPQLSQQKDRQSRMEQRIVEQRINTLKGRQNRRTLSRASILQDSMGNIQLSDIDRQDTITE